MHRSRSCQEILMEYMLINPDSPTTSWVTLLTKRNVCVSAMQMFSFAPYFLSVF